MPNPFTVTSDPNLDPAPVAFRLSAGLIFITNTGNQPFEIETLNLNGTDYAGLGAVTAKNISQYIQPNQTVIVGGPGDIYIAAKKGSSGPAIASCLLVLS